MRRPITLEIVLLALAIISIAVTAAIYLEAYQFKKTALSAQGTIVDVDVKYSRNDDNENEREYTVHVKYAVDDVSYSGKYQFSYTGILSPYVVTLMPGKDFEVLYSSKNPDRSRAAMDYYSSVADKMVIPVSCSLIFSAMGIPAFFKARRNRKRREWFMANGTKVYAKPIEIKVVRSDAEYSEHALVCQYQNEVSGTVCKFEGDIYYFDLDFTKQNIPLVAIYVDPKNWKRYYVDVDSWTDELEKVFGLELWD